MEKPKTINSLMKYLRDEKNIDIHGSSQKIKLLNTGYYHAFKGYRYVRSPENNIDYHNFVELESVYRFDSALKSLFYPSVMFAETALKNRVLDIVLQLAKTGEFNKIYSDVLNDYVVFLSPRGQSKTSSKRTDNLKKAVIRRLKLRNKVYTEQSLAYMGDNRIVHHFLDQGKSLPIWAIFELLTLGEFGYFVSCMNEGSRRKLSKSLKLNQNNDTNAMLPQRLIFALKDLRNSIAHDDVIFDTRFNNHNKIGKQLKNAIKNEMGFSNIDFNTITDYLILLIFLLKSLQVSKTEQKQLIRKFERKVDNLMEQIQKHTFYKIMGTDYKGKILTLKSYIKSET